MVDKEKKKEYARREYLKNRSAYLLRAKKQRELRDEEEWKKYHKEWRDKNTDKVRASSKKSYAKRKNEVAEYKKEYKEKFPEIKQAHWKVASALKTGKLSKPSKCCECENTENIDAHHEDYSNPLEVLWLCSMCHHKRHHKLKQL